MRSLALLVAVAAMTASTLALAQHQAAPVATPLARLVAPAPAAAKTPQGKPRSAFGQAMMELTRSIETPRTSTDDGPVAHTAPAAASGNDAPRTATADL